MNRYPSPTALIKRLRVYSAGTRAAVPYPPDGMRLTRTSESSPASLPSPVPPQYSTRLMDGSPAYPPGTQGSRPATRQSTDYPLQPTKSRVRSQLHHPAAAAFAPATRLALLPYPVLPQYTQVLWTARQSRHPARKALAPPPDSPPTTPSNRLPPGLGTTEPCSERPGSRPAEHPTPGSRTLKNFKVHHQVPKEGALPT